MSRQNLLVSIK